MEGKMITEQQHKADEHVKKMETTRSSESPDIQLAENLKAPAGANSGRVFGKGYTPYRLPRN